MKRRMFALIFCGCTLLAQPPLVKMTPTALPQIVNPNIDGVDVVLSKAPGTFDIVNHSKKNIVGLSIWHRRTALSEAKQTGPHYILDGLDTSYPGIAGGAMANFAYSLQTKAVSLDWVLFSDGSFYGSDKDMTKINLKSRVRREFFRGLQAAPNWGNYVNELDKCGRDIKCARASGRPALEWNEINSAIRYVWSNTANLGNDRFERAISRIVNEHNRYPLARLVKHIALVKPSNEEDGWEFFGFIGTCNSLAAPAQQGILKDSTQLTTWITSVANLFDSCRYDFRYDLNATGAFSTSYDSYVPRATSYALGTFDTHVTAQCYNIDTQAQFNLTEGAQFGLPKAADVALQIYGVGDPKYYPRYAAQTFIGNSWTPDWNGGTLYFSLAFGYPEQYGPTANDDGGQTFTSVLFLAPWGDYTDVSGGSVTGLGAGRQNPITEGMPGTPFVSVNLNDERTRLAAWTNDGFGFFLQNFETNVECAAPEEPNLKPAVNVELSITDNQDRVISTFNNTRIIANPGKIATLTGHKPGQQTAGNGNGDSCTGTNPFQDCCCCLKASYGIDFCQNLCGLDGAISCDLTTGATAGGLTPLDSTAYYNTGVNMGYVYLGADGGGGGNGVISDPHLHCNSGFTPMGGQCVSNCPNSNVNPDAYGNCSTPPASCLWVGLGIYQCGPGPIYGGCDSWDSLGNCTGIIQGTDAVASSVCGFNYQTGFYENLDNCIGANPQGCYYNGYCNVYGTYSDCVRSLVCPSQECPGGQFWTGSGCQGCPSGDYTSNNQCYCSNGQPDGNNNACGACPDGNYPDQWGNCGAPGQDCSGSCYWCGPSQSCCPSDDCPQVVYDGKVQIIRNAPKQARKPK